MGVDLRLLPFDADFEDLAFSHTLFEAGRDYPLFEEINKIKAMPVPAGFTSFSGKSRRYEDVCYGKTDQTPYGGQLTYVLAGELVKITPEADNRQATAAWAYLRCLRPETKVALYWH